MNKQQLQQEIAELQKQLEEKQKVLSAMPGKWEPKGGGYSVASNGGVFNVQGTLDCRMFGSEFATFEQAEKASKAMRAHNRLLAYAAEFAPEFEYNESGMNWYVLSYEGEWRCGWDGDYINPSIVYMPERVAKELAGKLNSGEVEL